MLLLWIFAIPVFLFGWFMDISIIQSIAFWTGIVSFGLWVLLTAIMLSVNGNFLCYDCNKSFWKESSLEKHYKKNECPRFANTSSKASGEKE